jgi:hypothetical protein
MNKAKSRSTVEKQSVPEFYEDLIEDLPTCLQNYFLDDNMEEENFPDDMYNNSSDSEIMSEEKKITAREEMCYEIVHSPDGSVEYEDTPAVVSQVETAEDVETTLKPLREPQRMSDYRIRAEKVEKESLECPESASPTADTAPDMYPSPAYAIEDEILLYCTDCAVNVPRPDVVPGVLTRLEDVRLSDIPVAVLSPARTPVCHVSEASHYFSQYLEV